MEKYGVLRYEGCNFFRQRLVLATLSCRAVRIGGIRENDEEPGLREYEAGFIRLLDKLTNGSKIEINQTGTALFYKPGMLSGGTLEHDCSKQRAIGYFLEPLMMLAPFTKLPLKVTLRGVTSGPRDPSVDFYKLGALPVIKRLIPGEGLDLKVVRRGMWPEGDGEVLFSCPSVRKMQPVFQLDEGKVKRIRGIAYCMRVNPGMANRMVDSARGVLNNYLPDVYIYTDCVKGRDANNSPGYGLSLVSESTTGVSHVADLCSLSDHLPSITTMGSLPPSEAHPSSHLPPVLLPEDIGRSTALLLVDKIVQGGCVDGVCQTIPVLYMALGQKDVSKLRIGRLTDYTIQFLRHMKDFFHLEYKISVNEEETDSDSIQREIVTLTCVGVGYSNLTKSLR